MNSNNIRCMQPLIFHDTLHTLNKYSIKCSDRFAYCEIESEGSITLSIIPDEHLICILGFDTCSSVQEASLTIAGSFTAFNLLELDSHRIHALLFLRPEDFGILFRVLPGIFTDRAASYRDLTFPVLSGIKSVLQKLPLLPDFEDRAQLISDINMSQPSYSPVPKSLISMLCMIREVSGMIHISELSAEFVYSERHITRLFSDILGYNAKTSCRNIRFHAALEEIQKEPNRSNSEFILNLDYSDQAHFQRDFKYYMHMTPRQYIKLISE